MQDEMTAAAMRRLCAHGLTPASMAAASEREIDALINNVGFHNNKSRFIKATAQILMDKYDGDIPDSMEVRGVRRLEGRACDHGPRRSQEGERGRGTLFVLVCV